MRALIRLILLLLGVATIACPTAADPRPAADYAIEVVRKEGAIFSGLAEADGDLILTNLADGRLYRFRTGNFQVFGPELPHGFDSFGDPAGPYRVQPLGRSFLVSQGWTPIGVEETSIDHSVIEIDENGIRRVLSSDFWNPFDFLLDGEDLIVIDSAENAVERVSNRGEKKRLFTFARLKKPGQALRELSPTEFSDAVTYEVQAVPTGIVRYDGRLFVSLFSGFPYLQGGGAVVSLDANGPNESARLEVGDISTPVDLAFTGAGGLLVLEHGRFDQSSGFLPESGRLIAIDLPTAERQILVEGLSRPASLLIRANDVIVIASLDGTLTFLTPTGQLP